MAKNDELRNIGIRLQKFRLKADMTQEELAEAVGVGESTIRRYESGESDMPTTVMFKIASALKINMRYLKQLQNLDILLILSIIYQMENQIHCPPNPCYPTMKKNFWIS